MKSLTCRELAQALGSEQPPLLVDVMAKESPQSVRIAGAVNACVYEIVFVESIAKLASSKDAEIVVYGLNDTFHAAREAYRRLADDGYTGVKVLQGGLEGWLGAGLPTEGSVPSEHHGGSERRLDTVRSIIRWTGRNLVNQHHGTLAVTGGFLRSDGQTLTSALVETHFDTLACGDIEDQKMNAVLLAHLKTADFFLASEFPTASFNLSGVEAIDDATAGRPNIRVKGELTLRGQTHPIDFDAVFHRSPEQWVVQANLEIDRTRWNSRYGSGRFFEALGKHLVNDFIALQIQLFA